VAEITGTRVVAADVLRAVSRGRRLDLALGSASADLSSRDRRWVQEASYGTVRLRGRLDFLLDGHLARGLDSLPPPVLDLLRLGAYQLLFMDGVPAYAAISQTVEQIRGVSGSGGARLANGVLRNLGREGADLFRFPRFEEDPGGFLTSWGSHPRWMIDRWLRQWSPEEVRRLVEWNNKPPPLYFRPLGPTLDEARASLAGMGLEVVEAGPGIPCLQLPDGTNPARILDSVSGIVQDPGAALVTTYARFPRGQTVADLCAAPGGKALALASGGAYVLAADRSARRLRLLDENRRRVGVRMELVAALAQAPPFREVPNLLLDVPCTGTGTLRRHPDARWRLEEGMVGRLAELQRSMLEAGSRLLTDGGVLVYSTCSLEPEENREQVETFLSDHPEFRIEEPEEEGHDGILWGSSEYLDDLRLLTVVPQTAGFDGAFAARMVKRT